MMQPSEGEGTASASSASASHAALLVALQRVAAQEEAEAAAQRAALTAAAYASETEGGSPAGLASPWQLLSREGSADDLLAQPAPTQQRAAAQAAAAQEAAEAVPETRPVVFKWVTNTAHWVARPSAASGEDTATDAEAAAAAWEVNATSERAPTQVRYPS